MRNIERKNLQTERLNIRVNAQKIREELNFESEFMNFSPNFETNTNQLAKRTHKKILSKEITKLIKDLEGNSLLGINEEKIKQIMKLNNLLRDTILFSTKKNCSKENIPIIEERVAQILSLPMGWVKNTENIFNQLLVFPIFLARTPIFSELDSTKTKIEKNYDTKEIVLNGSIEISTYEQALRESLQQDPEKKIVGIEEFIEQTIICLQIYDKISEDLRPKLIRGLDMFIYFNSQSLFPVKPITLNPKAWEDWLSHHKDTILKKDSELLKWLYVFWTSGVDIEPPQCIKPILVKYVTEKKEEDIKRQKKLEAAQNASRTVTKTRTDVTVAQAEPEKIKSFAAPKLKQINEYKFQITNLADQPANTQVFIKLAGEGLKLVEAEDGVLDLEKFAKTKSEKLFQIRFAENENSSTKQYPYSEESLIAQRKRIQRKINIIPQPKNPPIFPEKTLETPPEIKPPIEIEPISLEQAIEGCIETDEIPFRWSSVAPNSCEVALTLTTDCLGLVETGEKTSNPISVCLETQTIKNPPIFLSETTQAYLLNEIIPQLQTEQATVREKLKLEYLTKRQENFNNWLTQTRQNLYGQNYFAGARKFQNFLNNFGHNGLYQSVSKGMNLLGGSCTIETVKELLKPMQSDDMKVEIKLEKSQPTLTFKITVTEEQTYEFKAGWDKITQVVNFKTTQNNISENVKKKLANFSKQVMHKLLWEVLETHQEEFKKIYNLSGFQESEIIERQKNKKRIENKRNQGSLLTKAKNKKLWVILKNQEIAQKIGSDDLKERSDIESVVIIKDSINTQDSTNTGKTHESVTFKKEMFHIDSPLMQATANESFEKYFMGRLQSTIFSKGNFLKKGHSFEAFKNDDMLEATRDVLKTFGLTEKAFLSTSRDELNTKVDENENTIVDKFLHLCYDRGLPISYSKMTTIPVESAKQFIANDLKQKN